MAGCRVAGCGLSRHVCGYAAASAWKPGATVATLRRKRSTEAIAHKECPLSCCGRLDQHIPAGHLRVALQSVFHPLHDPLAQGDPLRSMYPPFVARHHWRRRGASPDRFRANRVPRGGHLHGLLTMAYSHPRGLWPRRHPKEQDFAQRPDMVSQPRGHRWRTRPPSLGRARAMRRLGNQ
jgi:hypothetical protein